MSRRSIWSPAGATPRRAYAQVTDKDGNLRWAPTTVNVDNHLIRPTLDPAAVAANPDKAVEDYVASLSTLPMDRSQPLWEFHLFDFPTSEATSTAAIRVHHSLGDGMSLLTLLMACTRSAADPTRLPAMPPLPSRTGAIYQRPRPSAGVLAIVAWVWSFVVLAWHTVVDVVGFFATILFLKDPHTLFKRVNHAETQRKRIVHRRLSLDDVKFVKNAMKCACVDMIKSGKESHVKWGNELGFIILPFFIGMHSDPLDYVRKGKKVVDRKKSSLEVVFTHVAAEVIFKVFGLKAASAIFHRMISHTTISFANMTGPVEQVEFCGHPIVFIAPSGYGPPEALTVNYQSYVNTIMINLALDEGHFPDYDELLDDFVESLEHIKNAASRLGMHHRKA
ncbi:hypothetical protein CFC21_042361 [Triticum aestivum]|uniref:Diacylglycerol O-acyltransferase n=2 Tax=Triticum aestivum TaxID=4565 RepID=A0A9R1FM65_WHEAT|nr:hypothetical protein CFC21_042361 [Triticum aestivum]